MRLAALNQQTSEVRPPRSNIVTESYIGSWQPCHVIAFFGAYASTREPPLICILCNSDHSGLRALNMLYHTHVHQHVHAPDPSSCFRDMLFFVYRDNMTVVGTQVTVPTVTWVGGSTPPCCPTDCITTCDRYSLFDSTCLHLVHSSTTHQGAAA
jgi:hypothetical protein